MKILITGNMGYVGSVLVPKLRAACPGDYLVGFDAGYFAGCLVDPTAMVPEHHLNQQVYGNIRNDALCEEVLEGVDAVIHLAAMSNDPLGKRFEAETYGVNYHAAVSLAKQARHAGVRSFIFASTCSIYGGGEGDTMLTEASQTNPLTVYANSKLMAEESIVGLADKDFAVTAFRFGTACGFSPRMRLDLALNDFVASARTLGQVTLLSKGNAWRPMIHVEDMARLLIWAVGRPAEHRGLSCINALGWCERILWVADRTSTLLKTALEIRDDAQLDKRSYRVSSAAMSEAVSPKFLPEWNWDSTIVDTAKRLPPNLDANFRESQYARLPVLARQRGL